MGNYSSCIKGKSSNTKVAHIIDSLGQVKLIELPTTVAELMLENPGFALSLVDEIRRTRRMTAMKADDSLLGRKVYLLVPVDKVNSRLSDLQLAAIDTVVRSCSKKTSRRTRVGSKVSPIVEETCSSGEILEDLDGKRSIVSGEKKKFCRNWTPVLEPILEA